MSATPLTFEDLRIAIVTALKGVATANVAIGQGTMDMAANKAIIRVLADAPLAEHAGSCYLSATQTLTAGVGSLPADCLIPLALDISGSKMVKKPLMETLRVEQTGLPGTNEYVYTFAGNKVIVRPNATTSTLHYLKMADLMVGASDPFPLGPAFFLPCVLAATLTAAEKMAGVDSNQVGRLQSQYDQVISRLNGNLDKDLLMAWATQGARSVTFGPSADNSGM